MIDWISVVLGSLIGLILTVPLFIWQAAKRSSLASELTTSIAILSETTKNLQELRASHALANAQLLDAEKRAAALQSELKQTNLLASEKLAQMVNVKAEMTQNFRVLAEDVMKRHGESFSQLNKEQMDALLNPLRHKITDFQQELQKSHTENAKERASLTEHIKSLSETSGKMTLETHNLTRALKGETRTQGAWGELILDTILERSGLREGHEYITQDSHTTDEGRKQRLDVLINLPDGKKIIVDSKVSLKDFEAFINAETDLARTAHLKAHCRSIRSHIKLLSEKAYQKLTEGGLDFVVMFMPNEGALAAALSEDSDIIGYATEMNVTVVTPTTLMIALRTIANVWHVENRNRNADQIADRAGKLYDKFVGFVDDMMLMDKQLTTVRGTFDRAVDKLSNGRGNLVRQAETIKSMGAKATKSLPASLMDEEE
jgi:DNA recombination protein RmuC